MFARRKGQGRPALYILARKSLIMLSDKMKARLGRLAKPTPVDGTIIVACLILVFVLFQTPLLSHAQAPTWDGDFVAYKVGDVVSYENNTYKCLQAHTSEPNWNPQATPALWDLQPAWSPFTNLGLGGLDFSGPVAASPSPNPVIPTATSAPVVYSPTATPSPELTATPSPEPTATPSPTPSMPTATPSPTSNVPAGKNAGNGPVTLNDDAFASSNLDNATLACLKSTHPEVTDDSLQPICATFYNDNGLMADGQNTHPGACAGWATQYPFGTTLGLYKTADASGQPVYQCTIEDVFGGFIGTSTDEKMGFCQNHIDVWDGDVNADIQRGVQPMFLKVTGMDQDIAAKAKANDPSSPGCGLSWS
jgi:hypothetical protein